MIAPSQPRLRLVRPPTEAVILLHGMLASRRSMSRLERRLDKCGYWVINWGYRSLAGSIQNHAARLSELLEQLDADADIERLHFVTHSMGGIIVRYALHRRLPAKGGRMVMLAPPNAGSRLASLPLGPLRGWFPQITQLSEAADSLVNRLPEPSGLEVGVIAASNDFVVEVAATRLASQRDHIVLTSTHQQLPAQPQTGEQVLTFLRSGRFRPQTAKAELVPLRRAA